jgi:hypothetical protein
MSVKDAQEPMERAIEEMEEDARLLAELNRDYAFVLAGGKGVVMREESGTRTLINFDSFKQFFMNYRIKTRRKMIPLGQWWLEHPQRRQYRGIEFAPIGGRAGYYNLWKGFAVEPREGDCSKFLAHIRDNVCHGVQSAYDWNIGWWAQIFQQPEVKPGTSLAYTGEQGVGKTKVGQVMARLLGTHYARVSNPRYVTGNFNSHLSSLLVLHADEAFWAGDVKAEGILRDMITGDTQFIEHKGVDPIAVDNYTRLFVTGPKGWLVPAAFGERRFGTFEVSGEHKEDFPYFEAIDKEMDDGGDAALLHYLLNFDLSKINLRSIPKTAVLLDQKIASMTAEQAWWFDTLQRGELPWGCDMPNTCHCGRLYNRYIAHARKQGVARKRIETAIGMFLKKLMPDLNKIQSNYATYVTKSNGTAEPAQERVVKRGWIYEFPSLVECRQSFADAVGQEIKWDGVKADDGAKAEPEWQHDNERMEGDDLPF